jgi:hypothetical protein
MKTPTTTAAIARTGFRPPPRNSDQDLNFSFNAVIG